LGWDDAFFGDDAVDEVSRGYVEGGVLDVEFGWGFFPDFVGVSVFDFFVFAVEGGGVEFEEFGEDIEWFAGFMSTKGEGARADFVDDVALASYAIRADHDEVCVAHEGSGGGVHDEGGFYSELKHFFGGDSALECWTGFGADNFEGFALGFGFRKHVRHRG